MKYIISVALVLAVVTATISSLYDDPWSAQSAVFTEGPKLGPNREWRNYPVIADFNQDGTLDIVATHRRPLHENSLHIWLGRPDRQIESDGKDGSTTSFVSQAQTWPSPGYSGISVGDIDGDGDHDIVAASHFNRFQTYLQDSDTGNFDTEVVKTNDGYVNAELADLDQDGALELLLLGYGKVGIEIYKRKSEEWELKETLAPKQIGRDLKVLDMNGDGRLDIVASLARNGGIFIFYQTERGNWSEPIKPKFSSETDEFRSIAIADIDRDGLLDLALNGGYAGPAEANGPDVYLNSESGDWKPINTGLKTWKYPTPAIALGDFNGDGHLDLVAGGNDTAKLDEKAYGLFLFLGDGGQSWKLNQRSGLPAEGLPRPYAIRADDLNSDGVQDLVVTHGAPEEGSGFVSVWYGKDSGKRV